MSRSLRSQLFWFEVRNITFLITYIFNHIHSYKSVQRLRGKLSLCGTRQQDATAEMIFPFYTEIRERFPTMGARAMVAHLRQNYNLKVSEYATFLASGTPFLTSRTETS